MTRHLAVSKEMYLLCMGGRSHHYFLNNPFQQLAIFSVHPWEQIVGFQKLWACIIQQCGRFNSESFSFSATLSGNNGKCYDHFQQFCHALFQFGSCRKLIFLHFHLFLALCFTELTQKENSSTVNCGLMLPCKMRSGGHYCQFNW